jgi:hypothetical protein
MNLIGEDFDILGVRFRGVEERKPCHWMNQTFALGAEGFLRGQGGLRAMILNDGKLLSDLASANFSHSRFAFPRANGHVVPAGN